MITIRRELDELKESTDKRISELEHECANLRKENDALKQYGPVDEEKDPTTTTTNGTQTGSTGREIHSKGYLLIDAICQYFSVFAKILK